jgi:uncharacterized protein YnzC (UPF0291/DUF896 family)
MRLTANTGQLSNAFNTAGAHVRTFTSNVNSATQRMTAGLQKVYQQLNGFSTISRLAAAAGGYSILSQTLQRNLEFEKSLLDMKQTAEMTVAQAAEMRRLALDAASGNLALPSEMVAGMKAFSAAGMKFENIRPSIEESARAAVAFRSSVEQMANLDFDLQDKMKLNPSQIKDAHNMLLYHAKSGRYEAAPMAMEAPKYLNSVAGVGISGMKGLNFTAAMTQQLMKLAPATQPAEVATFIEHGLAHITSRQQVKGLAKFGIDVKKYMPNGKFYGEGGVQGALDLAAEMKAKGLDNPFKLDQAGFREMYTKKFWKQLMQYQDEIKKAMAEGERAAMEDMVGRDKAEIMNSNYGKVKQFQITKEKGQLSDGATDAVGAFAGLQGWAAENPKTAIAGGTAALIAGRMLWKKMLGNVGGGLMDKATGAVGGAGMPVMVTNWPADLGGKLKASERLARLPGAASSAGTAAAGAAVAKTALGTAATVATGAAIVAAPLVLAYGFKKWQESESGRQANMRRWKLEGEQLDRRINNARSAGDTYLLTSLQKQREALNNRVFASAQNASAVWKQELTQLDQRIAAAKQAPTPDKEAVKKLEVERADLAAKLDGLIAELRALVNRPLQVNLDSRPIVDAVNAANGRDARRQ